MFKFIIRLDSYLVCPAKSDIILGIVKKIGRIGANYCMWAMKMAELYQM